MNIFTTWEASEFLAKNLPKRDARKWYGYLKHNPKKYLEQDGYKVNYHVLDGELLYTEASLKAFVNVHKRS
jgi:hypothetical protein